ncbi:MAG TPA: DUF664 domain-containing protein [Sporichthyaceae bacterium]|jgi:hypothetical protein|nr:DUF664 domain-containing protein [Sporichthyaceae bacterium]
MSTEHDVLIETMHHQRALMQRTANGLTDEQARTRSTVGSLSVGGIIKHLIQVKRRWSDFVLKGPEVFGSFTAESFAAHEAGLVMTPDDRLAELLAGYEAAAAGTDDRLRSWPTCRSSNRCRSRRGGPRAHAGAHAGWRCT